MLDIWTTLRESDYFEHFHCFNSYGGLKLCLLINFLSSTLSNFALFQMIWNSEYNFLFLLFSILLSQIHKINGIIESIEYAIERNNLM